MPNESNRLLIFGAHPDDGDVKAGGLAALYSGRGFAVQMVSLTNGDAGHHEMGGAPLAWRRRQEAEAAGARLGAEYLVLDTHDGELLPALEVRHRVVAIIRRFKPDLIVCPRPWDYHPDHRATAQVVLDALYMSTVPNIVSGVPHLRHMPVALYAWDHFTRPYPFVADVVIDIGAVIERKIEALSCHASQVYEWLPYNRSELGTVPSEPAERLAWLKERFGGYLSGLAEMYREQLVARYGPERGRAVRYAEAFEVSEYGAPLTPEAADKLLPF